jgi:hypothetical protein
MGNIFLVYLPDATVPAMPNANILTIAEGPVLTHSFFVPVILHTCVSHKKNLAETIAEGPVLAHSFLSQ